MKITIEPTEKHEPGVNYPTVTMQLPGDDFMVDELLDELIKPALVAWGYSPELVEEAFGDAG